MLHGCIYLIHILWNNVTKYLCFEIMMFYITKILLFILSINFNNISFFWLVLRCFKLSLTAISAPPIHPIWRDDAIVLTEVLCVMSVFRSKNIYDINKIRDHNCGKTKTQFLILFFIKHCRDKPEKYT